MKKIKKKYKVKVFEVGKLKQITVGCAMQK
jgi:hypothetical protein